MNSENEKNNLPIIDWFNDDEWLPWLTDFSPLVSFIMIYVSRAMVKLGIISFSESEEKEKKDYITSTISDFKNNTALIHIASNFSDFKDIKNLTEVLFLLKNNNVVENLFLRFFYKSEWDKIWNTDWWKIWMAELKANKEINFEEIVWDKDDTKSTEYFYLTEIYIDWVSIKVVYWFNIKWSNDFKRYISWLLNLDSLHNKNRLNEAASRLILKFWIRVMEIIEWRTNFIRGFTDPLTWLFNRNIISHLDQIIQKEEKKAWLIMLDIDKFKDWNDLFWHDSWDKALVYLTAVIIDILNDRNKKDEKNFNLCIRLWWEELAIIFSWFNIDNNLIVEIWAELSKRLVESWLKLTDNIVANITASMWWVIIDPRDDWIKTIYEALKAADEQGLYVAKIKRNELAVVKSDLWNWPKTEEKKIWISWKEVEWIVKITAEVQEERFNNIFLQILDILHDWIKDNHSMWELNIQLIEHFEILKTYMNSICSSHDDIDINKLIIELVYIKKLIEEIIIILLNNSFEWVDPGKLWDFIIQQNNLKQLLEKINRIIWKEKLITVEYLSRNIKNILQIKEKLDESIRLYESNFFDLYRFLNVDSIRFIRATWWEHVVLYLKEVWIISLSEFFQILKNNPYSLDIENPNFPYINIREV